MQITCDTTKIDQLVSAAFLKNHIHENMHDVINNWFAVWRVEILINQDHLINQDFL